MSVRIEYYQQPAKQESLSIAEDKSVDIFGVRISPANMVFRNAFEGRTYNRKLSIQNIGKSKVLIRIISTSSVAYKIDRVKGVCLSSGMCLTRNVTFIYAPPYVKDAVMEIYINDSVYEYHMSAISAFADISVTPQCLDFGTIDASFNSNVKTLVLTNNGWKASRFFIDFSKKDHQLLVDPIRGILGPNSSKSVNVSILSTAIGPVNMELWLICEEPIVIKVTGTVIKPKFEAINACSTSAFNIIDFPVTYIGGTCVETIFVRNDSDSPAMFSFVGEREDKIMELKECQKIDSDFKYFDVFPKDGLAEPKEVKVLHFRFEPRFSEKKPLKPFYFAPFRMYRIRCKYLTVDKCRRNFPSEDQFANTLPVVSESFALQTGEDNSIILKQDSFEEFRYPLPFQERDYLSFYLHGKAEPVSVTVVPDELILCDLVMGARETRVLELANHSMALPIIIAYKKTPFIDVDPKIVFIKPYSSKQVAATLSPYQLGVINTKMHFELLFYDHPKTNDDYKVVGGITVSVRLEVKSIMKLPAPQLNKGLTPNYIRDVGKFCQNVTFKDDKIQLPKATMAGLRLNKKECEALIAFPNDTQKSLRPWRSNMQCKTIFAKYPRYIPPITDDELTAFDQQFKINVNKYYTSHIRKKAAEREGKRVIVNAFPDYELSDPEKLLSEDVGCPKLPPLKFDRHMYKQFFIALTPSQMNNVVVSPIVLRTGAIVPYRRYHFNINVKNNNPSWIRLIARSDNPNILFPFGSRGVVKSSDQLDIPVIYLAASVGCYTINLDVVVNECIVFAVTVVADVCTPHLKLNKSVINFTDRLTQGFVQINNPLNADIYYMWCIPTLNFEVNPREGIIKSYKSLMCQVRYLPNIDGPLKTEAEFFSDDKLAQQLKLVVKSQDVKLYFVPKELIFENMPLNVPVSKEVRVVNDKSTLQTFTVVESDFSKYMKVNPMEGMISANSYILLTLTIWLPACVNFRTILHLDVSKSGSITMVVTGNVVYPDITVTPSTLKFQRIPASSFSVLPLTFKNNSASKVSVKFNLDQYPEYDLYDTKKRWLSNPIDTLILEAYSIRNLFLFYIPLAASSDGFILPMIFNGILGPVMDTDTTNQVSYFITEIIPDSCFIETPLFLPAIWVKSHSTPPKLCFSRIHIRLWYTLTPSMSRSSYLLRIQNTQKERENFCFRLDDIEHPFHIEHERGPCATVYRRSFVCSLPPGEEIAFNVSFKPDTPGSYRAHIPVFIKSDNSKHPHNILIIEAHFSPPTIKCHRRIIYLKPIPLGIRVCSSKEFIFYEHHEECLVSCKTNSEGVSTEVIDTESMSEIRKVVIRWHLGLGEPGLISLFTTISCSCGAQCEVRLVCVRENCLLTNYAFVAANMTKVKIRGELKRNISPDILTISSNVPAEEKSCKVEEYNLDNFFSKYPTFPSCNNEFTLYMDECIDAVETWAHFQGFFGGQVYKVPIGINFVNFEEARQHAQKYQTKNYDKIAIPYRMLLFNLVGKELEKHLTAKLCSFSEHDKVIYTWETYKYALNFISTLGAYLPHVKPEYLLEYSFYYEYKQIHNDDDNDIMNVEEFTQLTKQCWLDLILQTYKVTILRKACADCRQDCPPAKKCKPHDNFHECIKSCDKEDNVLSSTELMLRRWLQFHYDQVRLNYWRENICLRPIDLGHFDQNMEDGFVFAAVTLAYCPYLEDHFKKLYPQIDSYEEVLHNNIVVLEAWEKLNLTITTVPQVLAQEHSVVNLLLSIYLYDILPDMYPCETLEFTVGLSAIGRKVVEIKNHNDFQVAYSVFFIGPDPDAFTTQSTTYVIPPQNKCVILVSYKAGFIKEHRCTLILSGETAGYHYAKSKVISLIGRPDVSHVITTMTLTMFPYTCREVFFKIRSPYQTNTKTSYSIQFAPYDCASIRQLDTMPYQNEVNKFVLFRFFPLTAIVEFDETGLGILPGLCSAFFHAGAPTRIYFRNCKVGCFGIMIDIKVSDEPKFREVIKVIVPKPDGSINLRTRREVDMVYLNIPCRNRLMWKTIVETLTKTCGDDKESLEKIASSEPGMHVLQKVVVIGSQPKNYFLCRTVRFRVRAGNTRIKLPKYVDIEDTCLQDCIRIPIQLERSNNLPKDFTFTLFSTDGMQVRYYKTSFMYSDD